MLLALKLPFFFDILPMSARIRATLLWSLSVIYKFFRRNREASALIKALNRSQSIIEFDLEGRVLHANNNFCSIFGYEPSEIRGRHHRMFVEPSEAASPEYHELWMRLGRGEFDQRQYKRIGRGGREVWIAASYNPVFDKSGPYKIVKLATDITAAKLKSAEDAGKINAMSRVQAIAEFTPDGFILNANSNFLGALGYQLREIQGQHHSMFCDHAYASSNAYQFFWEKLRGGLFIPETLMLIGKGGKEIWMQASYNPILDMNGQVFKVMTFATEVSAWVRNVQELTAGLQALSTGDREVQLPSPFIASLEPLRLSFNDAAKKVRSMMTPVKKTAPVTADDPV